MRNLARLLLATLVFGFSSSLTAAQEWPEKPIRLVIPFAPGGTIDILARALAQKISPRVGQPVLVENRPGAGGQLGIEHVARSPADGYTFGVFPPSSVVIKLTNKNAEHDIRDLAPVTLISYGPQVIAVNTRIPATTVKELLDYGAANPDSLNFGSTGAVNLLDFEYFRSITDIKSAIIPYNGGTPTLLAVMSNQVQWVIMPIGVIDRQLNEGSLRALAVTSKTRWPSLPNVPTADESGVPGLESVIWNGVVAPANTPARIIDRMATEIRTAIKEPDLADRMKAWGTEPVGSTPAEFQKWIDSEVPKWRNVAEKAGVQPQ